MPTPPPTIATAPTMPDRSNRTTFPALAQGWTSWEKDSFHPGIVLMGANVYSNATEANAAAVSALNASVAALEGLNLSNWVSGTAYALGARVISPANGVAYRRIVAGAGTADPSTDTTNWAGFGTGSTTFSANDSITSSTQGWTSNRIVGYVSSGYSVTGHTHAGVYAPASHTHTSSSITDFTSAVNSLISAAGSATVSGALPIVYATTSNLSAANSNQSVVVTYAGQCNVILPPTSTAGRLVNVVVANDRLDVAVYVGTGNSLKIGTTTLNAADYLLLDAEPNTSLTFEWLDSTRQWRIV